MLIIVDSLDFWGRIKRRRFLKTYYFHDEVIISSEI